MYIYNTLDSCDSECPNQYYTKCSGGDVFEHRGHPLVCSNDGGCHSKLRILRTAATHFPVLSTFLHLVCCALESHKFVQNIDPPRELYNHIDSTNLDHLTAVSDDTTVTNRRASNTAKDRIPTNGSLQPSTPSSGDGPIRTSCMDGHRHASPPYRRRFKAGFGSHVGRMEQRDQLNIPVSLEQMDWLVFIKAD